MNATVEEPAPRARARVLRALQRPATLLALGAVFAVAGFQLWLSPSNPPGFMRDEAALAYNAYTIGHHGRDEDGARFPLYFVSFKDYKSPVFVYVLAAVFLVTGPHKEVARGLAAVSVLSALILLGLLAYRRSGRPAVGIAVFLLAGSTPWLFELGRVGFEVSMVPLLLVATLLALERTIRRDAWTAGSALAVVAPLGILTYTYAGARLLAPLLALACVVIVSRRRWRWLAAVWGGFALTQLPLILYSRAHPGALSARLEATTFVTDDMSTWHIAVRGVANYFTDLNLWRYVTSGDVKPYAHTWGAGAFLASAMLLALAGLLLIAVRHRSDPFWRYTVAALLVTPIPAATTQDLYHALRLAPLAVMLLVVAIPAVAWLAEHVRSATVPRVVAVALALGVAVQLGDVLENYRRVGPARVEAFEAGIPGLLAPILHAGTRVYVDFDDRAPLALARWYALTWGVDQSRVVRLPDGGVPPRGSFAFGRLQACDYDCRQTTRSGDYWIAEAVGPRKA